MLDWKVLRRELVIARIKAGLEEDQLAATMGVAVSTVYRIEKSGSGKHNPSLDVIAKWVEGCGLTLTAFIAIVEGSQTLLAEAQQKAVKADIPLANITPDADKLLRLGTTPPGNVAAQVMGAEPPIHGQTRTVPSEFETVLRHMREATKALQIAYGITADASGKALGDASRQAAKARAAMARKRPRAGRHRPKGA